MAGKLRGGGSMTCGDQHVSLLIGDEENIKINMNMCGLTDPGAPMKQNQDTLFSHFDGKNNIAIGVLDGHGREMGHLASTIARNFFLGQFQEKGFFEKVKNKPEHTIRTMYNKCHQVIKKAFKTHYQKSGYSVQENKSGGFLLKRKKRTQPYTCIQGGTTATIVVILEGKRMILSNVGDSMACLGGMSLSFSELKTFEDEGPAYASPYARSFGQMEKQDEGGNIVEEPETSPLEERKRDPLILTADHSPESESEFYRIRTARKNEEDPNVPELLFMYDAPNFCKYDRTSMYSVDSTGTTTLQGRGNYYKNIRNEWATLVVTPPHAQFQDALAFTRSIGDYHLHSYGVTCEPDIFELDLQHVLAERVFHDSPEENLVLVIATDGVWDNWQFKQLTDYLLVPSRIRQARENNGIQAIVREFMEQNITYAHKYFGNQADNMTAFVCYINAISI